MDKNCRTCLYRTVDSEQWKEYLCTNKLSTYFDRIIELRDSCCKWEDRYREMHERISQRINEKDMNSMTEPTEKQVMYAKYLAQRTCQELPKEYTKKTYSDFIEKWKPIVKHEDDGMNEPNAWQIQYM